MFYNPIKIYFLRVLKNVEAYTRNTNYCGGDGKDSIFETNLGKVRL
jgi:hypothetical protein